MSPASLCKRFAADRSGVIAVVFSLTLLPLLMGIGAAVDYSRATAARTDLQSAVDAAVLAVGRVAIETGRTNNTVQAHQAFDAGFRRGDGTTVTRFAVTQNLEKIVVDVDARIPLAFARLLRINHLDVNARAEVPLDKVTLEVALVLDNTGSMGSASKLVYLQQAANQLITKLENATVVNFTSYVALVPFNTQVRLFEGDFWTALPGVRLNHPKDAAEPALQVALPWRGCIADPDQPNDAQGYEASDGVPLNTGAPGTLLPAVRCEREGLRPLVPLTRDFTTLHARVNAMVADGDTNGTVGLSAGLALLTPDLGAGLVTGARPPARLIRKHMVPDGRGQHEEPVDCGPGPEGSGRSAYGADLHRDQAVQPEHHPSHDPLGERERDVAAQLRDHSGPLPFRRRPGGSQRRLRRDRGRDAVAPSLVLTPFLASRAFLMTRDEP